MTVGSSSEICNPRVHMAFIQTHLSMEKKYIENFVVNIYVGKNLVREIKDRFN